VPTRPACGPHVPRVDTVVCIAVLDIISALQAKGRSAGVENGPEQLKAEGSISERIEAVQVPHPRDVDGRD
jgi:hypothetical protein